MAPDVGRAQTLFERLVLPGDLTQSHADLQNKCSNCHEDFRKGAQVELCLDCHKEVAEDVTDKMGFHGRSAEAQGTECNHCHTDHKGRDFPIVILDTETFDHSQTDFPLEGAHSRAMCDTCHKTGEPFRKASSGCFDCHAEDDRHDGNLGKDCAQCHSSTDWAKVTEFDHEKTDFALSNAHTKVACTGCHAGEIYKGLPLTCVGCHRIQDVHDDRFGAKCETCHANTKWTEVRFDHGRDTDFALDGAHQKVACNDCHVQNVFDHPMKGACADCHQADDPHRGALGVGCADCHNTQGWIKEVFFDHDFTIFPLIGLHRIVPCEECHFDRTFQIAESGCVDCHAKDDKHKARLGPDCADCHNPNGWAFWLFDHNRQTKFALTGAHNGLKCESCHTRPVASRPELPRSCVACHRIDDVHRGQFGADCAACHSTSTFKNARLR
ncbi:MAG: cytochrome c3 family protein [Paracoccaceae bacterium]